jgi:hypothetical protein
VLPSLAGSDVKLTVSGTEAVAAATAETGLTSDEEGEIEDHLRGLGYVE